MPPLTTPPGGRPASNPPELLDARAVAGLMSISVRSVWRLRDAGLLPAPVRVGSMVRWRRDTLLSWLNEYPTETRRGGQ